MLCGAMSITRRSACRAGINFALKRGLIVFFPESRQIIDDLMDRQ